MQVNNLDNLGVVVTRPEKQARELAQLVERLGGRATSFPALEISPVPNTQPVLERLKRLAIADWAIFISVNAVEFGLELIDAVPTDLSKTRVASIGNATASALESHRVPVDLKCPPPAGSESLLSTTAMRTVRGLRIFIFRGMGGRELLKQTLQDRGAMVEYIECYQRGRAQSDANDLARIHRDGGAEVIVASSVDGLQHLVQMIRNQGHEHILGTGLVVIGERQLTAAHNLGWLGKVLMADDASNQSILNKLQEFAKN